MVSNMGIALQALNEVLVATRNISLQSARATDVADIVDSIEVIPLWMADATVDRTKVIVELYRALALEHPECRIAAATASRLELPHP